MRIVLEEAQVRDGTTIMVTVELPGEPTTLMVGPTVNQLYLSIKQQIGDAIERCIAEQTDEVARIGSVASAATEQANRFYVVPKEE